MKNLKHILICMLFITFSVVLGGCTKFNFGSNNIEMNKAIKPKNSSLDFKVTLKGLEDKSGYYVLAMEVENKNKDTDLNCGQSTLQLQYLFSEGNEMNDNYGSYKLRNKSDKSIIEDNITTYASALRVTNDNFKEEFNSVVIGAKETKIVYLPIAQSSIDFSIDDLELVYMDNKKGEYVVIN